MNSRMCSLTTYSRHPTSSYELATEPNITAKSLVYIIHVSLSTFPVMIELRRAR